MPFAHFYKTFMSHSYHWSESGNDHLDTNIWKGQIILAKSSIQVSYQRRFASSDNKNNHYCWELGWYEEKNLVKAGGVSGLLGTMWRLLPPHPSPLADPLFPLLWKGESCEGRRSLRQWLAKNQVRVTTLHTSPLSVPLFPPSLIRRIGSCEGRRSLRQW